MVSPTAQVSVVSARVCVPIVYLIYNLIYKADIRGFEAVSGSKNRWSGTQGLAESGGAVGYFDP
jgi:hypothetical protein